jgi:chloramphenicol-sensitive protein RarD
LSPREPGFIGILCALGAAAAWALYPFYFKATDTIPLLEMVAHRVIWTVVFLAPLLLRAGFRTQVQGALADPPRRRGLVWTGLLIGANWLVYTYAVTNDRVMDTSLGYFLSPLVAVALGVFLLGERLAALQAMAVGVAALAVAGYTIALGSLPLVALALPTLFALYGALRKRLPVDPGPGLFVECLVVFPIALGYMGYLLLTGALVFPTGRPGLDLLVVMAGIATIGPLFLFNAGAKRLDYITVGMMLYVAPSLLFLEAWLIFAEPLDPARLAAFSAIWAALALYTLDGIRRSSGRSGVRRATSVKPMARNTEAKPTNAPVLRSPGGGSSG